MEKNISKVRAHDAIVGSLYLVSVGLTLYTANYGFFMDSGICWWASAHQSNNKVLPSLFCFKQNYAQH